jgi:phosphate-selective porin
VGYVQNDIRTYWGWDAEPGQRNDGFDVRHLRGGVRLQDGRVSGQAVVDVATFANRTLGDEVAPLFTPRQRFKDMYVEVALGKDHVVRAGHFKLPVSREFLVAEQRMDFLERAMFSSGLAPGRDWGVSIHGRLPAAPRLEYMAGAFAGDNWAEASRARNTLAARLLLEPVRGLQLAVSASTGDVRAETGTAARSKGLQGKNASGWVFFKRPAVDGGRRRVGADVQYLAGPVTFTAEVMQSRERRSAGSGPDSVGLGGSGAVLWRVRGARSGAPSSHTAPVDLGLRYDGLRFDDAGLGPSSEALTGALNYQPRSWLRFMLNGILDRYGSTARIPPPERHGYATVVARVQLVVP